MSTVKYDKDTNTLQIGKGSNSDKSSVSSANSLPENGSLKKHENQKEIVKEQDGVRQLKGFILTVTNDVSDIERLKNGMFPIQSDKIKLFPALAGNDEEAIQAARNNGYEVVHIAPYEYLKFQTELIENVAKQANVEILINKDMFVATNLEKLN